MNLEDLKIVPAVEEQIAVQFTGKLNVLAAFNRQYLGHMIFKNGDIYQVFYKHHRGLKAFNQLIIDEYTLSSILYIVEPEVVDEKERQIHYPYPVIKNRMSESLKLYQESLKFKPPENVKLLIDGQFLREVTPVTPQEFDVLETLTEWTRASDIYQYCPLLEHEITWALVSLRKKNAIKTVAARNKADDSF
jgi:hypothetical protein